MVVCQKIIEFREVFPADLKNVDEAVVLQKSLFSAFCNQSQQFEIELLLREALINAVIHGSGENAEMSVYLTIGYSVSEKQFMIIVRDEGGGFDWRGQKKKDTDLSSENGRGVKIFEAYASGFEYNDCGNEIVIHKDM